MARLVAAGAAFLSVAACQVRTETLATENVEARMRTIATRYVVAKQNGMTGVVTEIERCYAEGSRFPVNPLALRDCLIMDTVATREDNTVGRSFGMGNLPYFEERPKALRWSRYGQLAGFTDAARQVRYQVDGATLVELNMRGVSPAF